MLLGICGDNGRYKLSEFEFSQQYLFFWDKLEKANCMTHPDTNSWVDFLECMIDLAEMPLESRLVQHLLSSPIGDGGQFDMVIVTPFKRNNLLQEPRQKIRRRSSYTIPRYLHLHRLQPLQLAHHRQTTRKRPHPP